MKDTKAGWPGMTADDEALIEAKRQALIEAEAIMAPVPAISGVVRRAALPSRKFNPAWLK